MSTGNIHKEDASLQTLTELAHEVNFYKLRERKEFKVCPSVCFLYIFLDGLLFDHSVADVEHLFDTQQCFPIPRYPSRVLGERGRRERPRVVSLPRCDRV